MRSWCYRHPTVTFFALLLWVLFFGFAFALNVEADRWVRAALDVAAIALAGPALVDWWERT
jgi:hypothetical protein